MGGPMGGPGALGGGLGAPNQYGGAMPLQPGGGLAPQMAIGSGGGMGAQGPYGQSPGGGMMMGSGGQMPVTNQMMPASGQDNNNYHFRFKIALVGDSGVGKTTFLDAISQTLGSVVENEESSELHIKVGKSTFWQ